MSESQIEALSAAAAKEATQYAGQGEVSQFLLSKDASSVGMRQRRPPLREFDVAEALGQSAQAHWQEAALLAQPLAGQPLLHQEASARGPGLAA